jgi:ESS family glutamate:Na+ symporter
MKIDAFHGFTLAILLLFVGKGLVARSGILRRYSIPESLVGGLACALVVFLLYYGMGIVVSFDLEARDALLLYFFAAIGLSTDARTLRHGGRPLLILSGLAIGFMVLQNLAGMETARAFGLDPRAGLMVGSISLTGGVGTTLAWSDYFVETLGIAQAQELGLAANMIGLIAACTIGGPIASLLMRRHRLRASGDSALEIGTLHSDEQHARLDYYGLLLALLWLNFALMLGYGINALVARTAVTLPAFVGCLLAGILLRMAADWMRPSGRGRLWNWPSMQPGIALVSDMSLGLFLTMALMGLRLWELQPVLAFITAAMLVQIALVIAFVLLICFSGNGQGLPSRRGVRGFRRYCAGIYRHCHRQHDGGDSGAWCGTRGVHCGALGMWVRHRYCERTGNQPDGRLGEAKQRSELADGYIADALARRRRPGNRNRLPFSSKGLFLLVQK